MNNERIRKALKTYGVYTWELGDLLGVSEATVTRKLRHELPKEEQSRIVKLIKEKGSNRND